MGNLIKKLGFSFLPIPEELMKSKAISWGAKYLFGIYAKANKEKVKWSADYLAQRMGCEVREVRRRKKELKDNNLIIATPRKGRVDEVEINLQLVTLIQTPDQMDRGQSGQGRGGHSRQGRGGRNGQGNSKEHSLKKTIKEEKNLKKLKTIKAPLIKKLSWPDNIRTESQEKVAGMMRPSGRK